MSINRVCLTGNLTKDIDVRATASGTNVASFTLAVNDRNGKEEKTYFIECVAWEQQAKYLSTYAKKGVKVGVEGKLQQRSYQSKNGNTVYVTEVVVDKAEILTPKKTETKVDVEKDEVQINDDDLPW